MKIAWLYCAVAALLLAIFDFARHTWPLLRQRQSLAADLEATERKALRDLEDMPPEVQRLARQPEPLVVNKSRVKSTVHRRAPLDAIGIKKYGDDGKVAGERLIIGLFTSVAYNSSPRDIPMLRRKLDKPVRPMR